MQATPRKSRNTSTGALITAVVTAAYMLEVRTR